jgi:hypothetical protein
MPASYLRIRRVFQGLKVIGVAAVLLPYVARGQATGTAPEKSWKQVEDAMGRPGQAQPSDVVKFAMPRKDLHVVLGGVQIKPALALGSWAAFKASGSGAMVMGDLVLTEDEIQPVMAKLQEGGIQEAAIHNHLIGESPRVMYMHIASHGDAVQMAQNLARKRHRRDGVAQSHADRGAPPLLHARLGE